MSDYNNAENTPYEYQIERTRILEKQIVALKASLALEESINKWQDIVRGVGGDKAARNCALCKLHQRGGSCGECIVQRESGQKGCAGTPYHEFVEHFDAEHRQTYSDWEKVGRVVQCDKCVEIALKVLNNLKTIKHSPRMTASEIYGRVSENIWNIHRPPSHGIHLTT